MGIIWISTNQIYMLVFSVLFQIPEGKTVWNKYHHSLRNHHWAECPKPEKARPKARLDKLKRSVRNEVRTYFLTSLVTCLGGLLLPQLMCDRVTAVTTRGLAGSHCLIGLRFWYWLLLCEPLHSLEGTSQSRLLSLGSWGSTAPRRNVWLLMSQKCCLE